MRYFLELSYKGTCYNGWQTQPNAPSVQQTLEKALSTLLRTQTTITGAGRTDTGVHAKYFVAHFDCGTQVEDTTGFVYHLNSILPEDISAMSLLPVIETAHARFDAVQREYQYHILPFKDPFRRQTTWQYYGTLNSGLMNEAAYSLLMSDDFTSFSKLHSGNKTNICKVALANWEELDTGELIFTIGADRFLRNMVRSITGTLFDVGRGKLTPGEFAEILHSRDRSKASGSAPAQGLFLSKIVYPKELFTSENSKYTI